MKNLEKIFNESIKIEIKSYELYTLFADSINEDAKFWKQLAKEERNHARLLSVVKDFIPIGDSFPSDIVAEDIDLLKIRNKEIIEETKAFNKNPNRKNAFELAIKNEHSLGEIHYQKFMNKVSDNKLVNLFKILNEDEKNHLVRIKQYAKKIKI